MYEGALRQAALARWPGTVPAGRVSDELWSFSFSTEVVDTASVAVSPVGGLPAVLSVV
jgi:arylsulfatase A